MKASSSVQVGTPAAANSIARLEGTDPDCFEAGKEVVVAFEARDAFGNTVSTRATLFNFAVLHSAPSSLTLADPWLDLAVLHICLQKA